MGERILIWGAGAIGGSVGGYLARAGHDVTLVDCNAKHVDAIRREGLRIVGPVDEFVAPVHAMLPDELEETWAITALAVKAQHTEAACRKLVRHLASDGYVLSLQNGLCETTIEQIAGRSRTMGALVGFMGDLLGPGEIRFSQRATFCVGELDGSATDRLARLVSILADFEPEVKATADIWGYLWGKLAFIALLYGTALATSTLAELFTDGAFEPAWRALAGEMVAVAASEGVSPRGFDGFIPEAFATGAPRAAAYCSLNEMGEFLRGSAKTHSGIWRDIAIHHRPTEVDFQIGPVVEIASRRGLAVPALRRLIDLVHAVERGELAQSDALIARICETGHA
ncbi:ketopantoate reductase family protein [Bradyrhizobium diazoefficiens]